MIQTEAAEIILIVAVKFTSGFISSLVPIIVSAILERHSLVVDTIVMVSKDQLPKKHYGEKLRKKVLSMYTQKEM